MTNTFHALGLSMHQPLGNLLALHNSDERWEARQILWCYDRVTRMLDSYRDVARLHVMFSGTLLKQFEDPGIVETFFDVVDIPAMMDRFRRADYIEYLGAGLYHPVFPLIPKEDWDAQCGWWHGLGQKLLGRQWYPGFCPPEIAFRQDMIPMLKRMGYRYVLVDSIYIKPKRAMRWEEIRYRPHRARWGDDEIVVVPIDRELSSAQLSGTSPWWWEHELAERTKFCDFPALVTTWSDGENGGWFRNTNVDASFWGHFYRPLLDKARAGQLGFAPVSINEYLDRFGPGEEVDVHPGAWNTGDHWGGDFSQWTGSLLQRRGLEEIERVSRAYHETSGRLESLRGLVDYGHFRQLLHEAYDVMLRGQTSCNLFWGSHWVHRTFDDLEQAQRLVDQVSHALDEVAPQRELAGKLPGRLLAAAALA